MVCLDTDFLGALIRGNPDAQTKADELDRKGSRLTTTPITAYELFLGAHKSQQRDTNLSRMLGLLSSLQLLDYDIWAAEKAAEYSASLESRGQTIGIRDSMIAGITARHNEVLVTRNVGHFSRITDIKLDPW